MYNIVDMILLAGEVTGELSDVCVGRKYDMVSSHVL